MLELPDVDFLAAAQNATSEGHFAEEVRQSLQRSREAWRRRFADATQAKHRADVESLQLAGQEAEEARTELEQHLREVFLHPPHAMLRHRRPMPPAMPPAVPPAMPTNMP